MAARGERVIQLRPCARCRYLLVRFPSGWHHLRFRMLPGACLFSYPELLP